MQIVFSYRPGHADVASCNWFRYYKQSERSQAKAIRLLIRLCWILDLESGVEKQIFGAYLSRLWSVPVRASLRGKAN